jgi:hypothetical protein
MCLPLKTWVRFISNYNLLETKRSTFAVTNQYLSAVTEHQMNMKKQKGADLSTSSESSSLDQNASRVPTGMASVKRKCGLKRLDSPNVVLC